MKSTKLLLYLSALLVLLGSCIKAEPSDVIPGGQAQDGVYFLRLREVNAPQMEAQLEGKLVLTEGCLRIQFGEDEKNAYSAIWLHEFSYRRQGDNVAVLDGEGQVVAQLGNQILVSGGGGNLNLSQEEFAESFLGPYRCPEPYWIVGYEVEVLIP